MPRPDRGVAQRYAAKKRRKRLAAGRTSAAVAEPISSIEGLEEPSILPAVTTPITPSEPRRTATIRRPSPAAQPRFTSRRPFSAYAEEYRYVLGDLRRVALVAGLLLIGLLALSFIIR